MNGEIIPSLLAADHGRLAEAVAAVRAAGVRRVQIDVMDGRFVPNITVGLPVVRDLARLREVELDVHLMIERPGEWVERFADAGARVLTVHAEADPHLHRTVALVRERGCLAGVAVNPGTPVLLLEEMLADIDVALVMTVDPGFGGQIFLRSMLPRIERIRDAIDRRGLPAQLQVDGGIGPGTAGMAARAGATQLVAGSSVFASDTSPALAIDRLRREILDSTPAAVGGQQREAPG